MLGHELHQDESTLLLGEGDDLLCAGRGGLVHSSARIGHHPIGQLVGVGLADRLRERFAGLLRVFDRVRGGAVGEADRQRADQAQQGAKTRPDSDCHGPPHW